VTGPTLTFSGIGASGYQRKSIALDPASVTTWIRSSTANQGIVLANQDPGKVLRIYSSEASDAAKRPTLSLSYQ